MLTDDERRLITGFFDRMGKVDHPRDPDAEKLINDLMTRNPATRYYAAQLAIFQEQALAEAQNRIRDLEFDLEQARNPQAAGAQAGQPQKGGMFSAFFAKKGPQRPQHVHAPGYQPGMFQGQQGGGRSFLATAAMTAVGVMGGILLGNAIMSALGADHAAQAATTDTGGATDAAAVHDDRPWGTPTETAQAYEDADSQYDSGGGFGGGDFGGGDEL